MKLLIVTFVYLSVLTLYVFSRADAETQQRPAADKPTETEMSKMTEHKWIQDYCKKSTSPCMQYFVMKQRSTAGIIFWISVFLSMVWVSLYALSLLLNVWIHSPTVNFIENEESSIQEIPFPTIKICSSNQMRKWVWERHENNNSSYWYNLKQYRSLMCGSHVNSITSLQLSIENVDYEWLKGLFNDCAISCSEIFQSGAKWQNTTIENVCRFVQPMVTVLGLCYNVNMIPSSQLFTDKYHKRYAYFFSKNHTYADTTTDRTSWNIDAGYSDHSRDNIFADVTPARTSGVGYYYRFELSLHAPKGEFISCPNTTPLADGDYLVTFANPADFYMFQSRSFVVPYSSTKIQITPVVKKMNSDLVWRSLEIRKCFFHDERKLSVFRHYSEANCRYECSLNVTVSMCGCLNIESSPFGTTDIKICGLAKKTCVTEAIRATQKSEMQSKCNCLPTCNTIEYDISSSSNHENWDYLKTVDLAKNDSRGATIEVVFKYPYFTAYRSGSVLNLQSLISNVGGILSLFLGLNVIGLFEILYVIFKTFVLFIVHLFGKKIVIGGMFVY